MRYWAIGCLSICFLGFAGAAPAADLTVSVTDIKNSKGQVIMRLFDDAEAFPTKFDKALQVAEAAIADGQATAVFSDVTPGRYAVAVAHDANGNGKLDMNFIGIPKEGIGASNDAKGRMGPPSFENAVFDVGDGDLSISIKMTY